MTLDDYLAENDISAAHFAGLIGVTEASISRIRKGKQNLSRDLMLRIIAASDDQITAESLVHVCDPISPSPTPSSGKAPKNTACNQLLGQPGSAPAPTEATPPGAEKAGEGRDLPSPADMSGSAVRGEAA